MCEVLTVHDPLEDCVFFDTSNCKEKFIINCPVLEVRYADPCDLYFCPEESSINYVSNNNNNNNSNPLVQTGDGFTPQTFGLNFNVSLNEIPDLSQNNLGLILGCFFGLLAFFALCVLIWKFRAKIWLRFGFGHVEMEANFRREAFEGDLSVLDGEDEVSIRSGDIRLEMYDLSSDSDSSQVQADPQNVAPSDDDADPAGLLDDSFETYFDSLPKKYRPKMKKDSAEDCVQSHVAQTHHNNEQNSDRIEDGVEVVQIEDLDTEANYKVEIE